jgi:ATP-dependent RNA helicase RhlE
MDRIKVASAIAKSAERTIIFTRTKRGADRVAQHLDKCGVAADAIHGNKSQNQRQRALDAFRGGRTRVLVATDIAARGIDVDNVTHVVNFELPEVAESYVHRIGRTARAGAEGVAVSLCDNGERGLLRAIEKLTRQSIACEDRRTGKPQGAAGADEERRPYRGQPQRHGRPQRSQEARPARGESHPHRGGEHRPARSENRSGVWDNHSSRPESRPHGGRPHGERPGAPANTGRPAGKPFRHRRPRPQNAGAGAPRA